MGLTGWIFFKDLTKAELEKELEKVNLELEAATDEDTRVKLENTKSEIIKELDKR